MSDGVIYMLVGGKHADHAVVSLLSLRDHYSGPVALIAGCDESEETFRLCVDDGRLGELELIRWNAPTRRTAKQRGSGIQYANKCEMGRLSPFSRTVFLDADTLVVGNFDDVFPRANTEEVRLTWFSDWWSNGRRLRNRIEPWREVARVEVARALGAKYPALNTGVLGFTAQSSRWFKAWREMTHRRLSFICDEIAAQLIFVDFPHCILDERWNCSVVYSYDRHGPHVENADPRIWHGHGKKFLKKESGRSLWLPYYERAVEQRIARIDEWTRAPKALAKYAKA